jgi:hypothetical protein
VKGGKWGNSKPCLDLRTEGELLLHHDSPLHPPRPTAGAHPVGHLLPGLPIMQTPGGVQEAGVWDPGRAAKWQT